MRRGGKSALLSHWLRRTRSTRSDRAPSGAGLMLANETLSPPEMALFGQMSRAEQAHAADVALYVARHLDHLDASSMDATDAGRAVIVAALLHDVGKVGAADGTFARALATLARPLIDGPAVVPWRNTSGGLVGGRRRGGGRGGLFGGGRGSGLGGLFSGGRGGGLGDWLDRVCADRVGRLARFVALLSYTRRGARMLREAGSHQAAVIWAAEHHRSERAWSVPADVGRLLADADRQ